MLWWNLITIQSQYGNLHIFVQKSGDQTTQQYCDQEFNEHTKYWCEVGRSEKHHIKNTDIDKKEHIKFWQNSKTKERERDIFKHKQVRIAVEKIGSAAVVKIKEK